MRLHTVLVLLTLIFYLSFSSIISCGDDDDDDDDDDAAPDDDTIPDDDVDDDDDNDDDDNDTVAGNGCCVYTCDDYGYVDDDLTGHFGYSSSDQVQGSGQCQTWAQQQCEDADTTLDWATFYASCIDCDPSCLPDW